MAQARYVTSQLGGPVVVAKGEVDIVALDVVGWFSTCRRHLVCDEPGSPRRCGGQGDVLAGAIAVFLALKTLGKEPWTSDLATHAGYSEAALMPCVREINRLHKAAGGAKLQAVRKKYSQEKHGCIATFNPINLDGALVVN